MGLVLLAVGLGALLFTAAIGLAFAQAQKAHRAANAAREWAVATTERLKSRIDESSGELAGLRRELSARREPDPPAQPPPAAAPGATKQDLAALHDEVLATRRALEEKLAAVDARLADLDARAAQATAGPAAAREEAANHAGRLASGSAVGGGNLAAGGGRAVGGSAAADGGWVAGGGRAAGGSALAPEAGLAAPTAPAPGTGPAAAGPLAQIAQEDPLKWLAARLGRLLPRGRPAGGGREGAPADDRPSGWDPGLRELVENAGRGLKTRARAMAATSRRIGPELSEVLAEVVALLAPEADEPGTLIDLPSLEDFVHRHGGATEEGTALDLLAAYLEEGRPPHPEQAAAPAVVTRQAVVDRAVGWADRLYELRARSASQPAGDPAIEELLAGIKELLRGFGLILVSPQTARPLESAGGRVMAAVPRPDLPPNTVLQVLRPGLCDATTGQVVRPAEVVVTSKA